MDICLEMVMFDSSLDCSTQGHLVSFVYFVILKASRCYVVMPSSSSSLSTTRTGNILLFNFR